MSETKFTDIAIIGGGLVGSLLAIYLAKRGFHTEVYERRPDMRKETISAGRSINLNISERGLHALRKIGLEEEARKLCIPMHGRLIHSVKGELTYQPYGKDDSEFGNSISRGELNKMLMDHAEKTGLVKFFYNQRATGINLNTGVIELLDERTKEKAALAATIALATDGSASVIRDELSKLPHHQCHSSELNYGYKELAIPPGKDGSFQIEKNALHIWPRGTYMLIALPNLDGSFTCTLFLPFEGPVSFAALKTPQDVEKFFAEQFGDAVPLLEDLTGTFFNNPTGHMTTIKAGPWSLEERVLLLGDAAHAIVPFFGQGMNCGFEDLAVLDDCIENLLRQGGSLYVERRTDTTKNTSRRNQEGSSSWSSLFTEFFNLRKENTDAIADMAVENFIEMRDKVADPKFQLEKAVERILQREFPGQYVSRYSLVTFTNVPYSLAMKAGLVTDEILRELCAGIEKAEQVDLKKAAKLISSKLAPVLSEHKEELSVGSR
jgi:kynurenine 3-monooxygenase